MSERFPEQNIEQNIQKNTDGQSQEEISAIEEEDIEEENNGEMFESQDAVETYKEQLTQQIFLEEQISQAEKNDFGEMRLEDTYTKDLERQLEGLHKETKESESFLLNVPEGEGRDITAIKAEIQEEQYVDGIEKEARAEFVQKFITTSLEDMLEISFKTNLDESKNKEQIASLIQQKVSTSVLAKANDFIENGGEAAGIGFTAEIKFSYFDSSEGEIKYVTEFNLTFHDRYDAAEEKDTKKLEENLINSQAEKEMSSAEKQGGLERGGVQG